MYGISNSQQQGGGGGGAASYKAIRASLTYADWQEVAGATPYFVGDDATTWAIDSQTDLPTKINSSDIGIIAGQQYTITITANGATYSSTATAESRNGMLRLEFTFSETDNAIVMIYDHADWTAQAPGNGSVTMVDTGQNTSLVITNFAGEGFGTTIQATISDSAIKVNSSVTMYTNTSEKIAVGEKTNGNVTLIAPSIPTAEIPYSLEIVGTDTEGLFEIVNAHVPTVTSELLNDSGFLTKSNFVAGNNVTITNENDNLIISATGGGGGGASQWNTIYEDTTGSGAVSVELSEPLQAGALYRITFDGSVYMFCSPDTGRASYTGMFTISTDVFQDANTMGHLSYNFSHSNTLLRLNYMATYAITTAGMSSITFADNITEQLLKITKVEVYR